MWKVWAWVFPVTLSFGEVFRKRNTYPKMMSVKQKKPEKVPPKYSKCIPSCASLKFHY